MKTLAFAVGVVVFCCAGFAHAADSSLIISEILVGGSSADEEFVELYNPTAADIDLKLLPLKLHIVSSTGSDTSKTLTYTTVNSTIKAHDYFLLASSAFKNKHGEIAIGATYSAALVSSGAVYIGTSATKDTAVIDSACWGTSTKCAFPLPDPKQNYSLERIANGPDWQESCETGGTPGNGSKECEKVETPSGENASKKEESGANADSSSGSAGTTDTIDITVSEKVYINEILPNPKGDEEKEEYIEIKNEENGPVDLFGWMIRDGSKTGKYVFKEHVEIKSGEYLAIYRPESKLALNNSKESVSLVNPQGKITSSVSWEKSQKNSSYNFDGENWRWSKYLTPGEKNKFDSPPVVKIDKIKTAYKNIDTEFSAKAKDKETKKLKYAWDFGDGKKSYLAKTSHKYLDTGKYTVTLSVSDESQTVEKNFSLEVKNYPRPDLEIVKIVPNPAGSDTDAETIDVQNNSGKKIDLKDWKIATGSAKAYNHPITGEFSLEPGETKILTQDDSKFSLNNKAGIVKLVMPDGKVVDTVEYQKDKIAEGEAYEKIDGEWTWLAPDMEEGGVSQEEDATDKEATGENTDANTDDTGQVLGASTENIDTGAPELPNEKAYSAEDAFIFYSSLGIQKSADTNYCVGATQLNLPLILSQLT